jgi:hypothetical protein
MEGQMASMVEMLMDMLSGDTLDKMSKQVGIPKGKTQQALPDIMAVLTGALAKNSSKKQGAKELSNALTRDHDGSILNNILDYIGNYQSGEGNGILGHLLADDRPTVEQGLSQKTGIDIGTIGNLLTMAAPLIMGMLGKTQKQQDLDTDSLKSLLGSEKRQIQNIAPEAIGILDQKPKSKATARKIVSKKKVNKLDISKVKIPQDVFDIAQARLMSDPGKYKGVNSRCQFDIKGSNGGKWYILANNEKKEISKGSIADPIATVIMKDSDFIELVLGKLNAPMALLTGKIKIKGDMNHIIKLVETVLS